MADPLTPLVPHGPRGRPATGPRCPSILQPLAAAPCLVPPSPQVNRPAVWARHHAWPCPEPFFHRPLRTPFSPIHCLTGHAFPAPPHARLRPRSSKSWSTVPLLPGGRLADAWVAGPCPARSPPRTRDTAHGFGLHQKEKIFGCCPQFCCTTPPLLPRIPQFFGPALARSASALRHLQMDCQLATLLHPGFWLARASASRPPGGRASRPCAPP